jgi:hypothetical protein
MRERREAPAIANVLAHAELSPQKKASGEKMAALFELSNDEFRAASQLDIWRAEYRGGSGSCDLEHLLGQLRARLARVVPRRVGEELALAIVQACLEIAQGGEGEEGALVDMLEDVWPALGSGDRVRRSAQVLVACLLRRGRRATCSAISASLARACTGGGSEAVRRGVLTMVGELVRTTPYDGGACVLDLDVLFDAAVACLEGEAGVVAAAVKALGRVRAADGPVAFRERAGGVHRGLLAAHMDAIKQYTLGPLTRAEGSPGAGASSPLTPPPPLALPVVGRAAAGEEGGEEAARSRQPSAARGHASPTGPSAKPRGLPPLVSPSPGTTAPLAPATSPLRSNTVGGGGRSPGTASRPLTYSARFAARTGRGGRSPEPPPSFRSLPSSSPMARAHIEYGEEGGALDLPALWFRGGEGEEGTPFPTNAVQASTMRQGLELLKRRSRASSRSAAARRVSTAGGGVGGGWASSGGGGGLDVSLIEVPRVEEGSALQSPSTQGVGGAVRRLRLLKSNSAAPVLRGGARGGAAPPSAFSSPALAEEFGADSWGGAATPKARPSGYAVSPLRTESVLSWDAGAEGVGREARASATTRSSAPLPLYGDDGGASLASGAGSLSDDGPGGDRPSSVPASRGGSGAGGGGELRSSLRLVRATVRAEAEGGVASAGSGGRTPTRSRLAHLPPLSSPSRPPPLTGGWGGGEGGEEEEGEGGRRPSLSATLSPSLALALTAGAEYTPSLSLSPLHPSAVEAACRTVGADLSPTSTASWDAQFAALDLLRRLALFHAQDLLEGTAGLTLHAAVAGTLPAADSLRSSLAKGACMALGDLSVGLGRGLDSELEAVMPVLVRRAVDTNIFMAVSAGKALASVIDNCGEARVLSALLSCAASKTGSVRVATAVWLDRAAAHAGSKLWGSRDLERLVLAAVAYAQAGSPEVRHAGTRTLQRLLASRLLDARTLAGLVPERSLVRLKAQLERPAPADEAYDVLRAAADGGTEGGEGGRAPSRASTRACYRPGRAMTASPAALRARLRTAGGNEGGRERPPPTRGAPAQEGPAVPASASPSRPRVLPRRAQSVGLKGRQAPHPVPFGGVAGGGGGEEDATRVATPDLDAALGLAALSSKDWRERTAALNGLPQRAWALASVPAPASARAALAVRLASELAARLGDGHQKVAATAVAAVEGSVRALCAAEAGGQGAPCDAMLPILLPALASSLASGTTGLAEGAAAAVDALLTASAPAARLAALVPAVAAAAHARSRSVLLDRLAGELRATPGGITRKADVLLLRTVLPSLRPVLEDGKPEVRAGVTAVLVALRDCVGLPALLEALAASGSTALRGSTSEVASETLRRAFA